MMVFTMFPAAVSAEGGALPKAVDGVITLTENVDISASGYTVTGDITLDLNGFELKAANTGTGSIKVPEDAKLTLKDSSAEESGRIYTESAYSGQASGALIRVTGGSFVMESGYIYAVLDDPANKGQFAVGVENGGSVTIRDGKIEAGWYAISGNGMDVAKQSSIHVEGGTLVSTSDYALYLPHNCVTTISDGIVTGAAGGIAQRRGTLRIKGGTIASEGTGDTGSWGDGTGGMGKAAVNVGTSSQGVYGDVDLEISGGNFTAAKEAVSVEVGSSSEYEVEVSIIGGSFADDVSKYVPGGYTVIGSEEDGYRVVAEGEIPDENAVAAIGAHFYSSLAAAVSAAENGSVIKMLRNTGLDSAVTVSGTLTLDLAGKTITGSNSANAAIAVTGNLTIRDSTAQKSPVVSADYQTVDYEAGKIVIASPNGAAVSVEKGGKLTLEGGIVQNTKNIGIGVHGSTDAASWNTPVKSAVAMNGGLVLAQEYGIGVYGNGASFVMKDGVISTVDNAAVAGNGSCTNSVNYGGTEIEISGGTLIGHITTPGYIANAIYHPQSGVLNITGGTIYADNGLGVLMRNGELNISGSVSIIATGDQSGQVGDLPSKVPGNAVVIDYAKGYNHNNDSADTRKVSISGGCFKADQNTVAVISADGSKTVDSFITGGSFSGKPDAAYLAEGYAVVSSGNPDCPYLVQKQEQVANTETTIVAEVAKPNVDDSELSGLSEDDVAAVTNAAGSTAVSADVMQQESASALEDVKQDSSIVEDAVKDLKDHISDVEAEGVTLYVQTYLDITPTDYDTENKTLALDITPMSRVVASTASESEDVVLEGDTDDEQKVNAVIVGTPKELNITVSVEMTLELPSDFVSGSTTAYVVHTKANGKQYVYDGEVFGMVLTFTNPNGFSEFIVYAEDPAAARVYAEGEGEDNAPGVGYMTLQDAVNAVKDGGTIVVKADGEATVSDSKSFTVIDNGNDIALFAGKNYRMEKENAENGIVYTFTYRGGSSSSDDPGSALPLAPGASYQPGEPSDPTQPGAPSGFVSDTTNDLKVNGTYQFRITSLDGTIPFLTVDNANFRVEFASQEGNDFFFKIHAQGAAGSTAVVSVNGVRLLTATVGGSATGVISDTTAPFTVKKGETYQFRLTASERPSFAAGSASFTVEYAGQIGSDYFYKVYAAGNVGDGCGFYINGEASPVAVATIA